MKETKVCEEVRAYLVQEQRPRDYAAALTQHLEDCGACAAFSMALGASMELFEPLRQAQAPADLFERIRDRAPQERPSKALARGLQAAAGLIAFLAMSYLLGRPNPVAPAEENRQPKEHLLSQLGRNLGASAFLQPTPEGELLAHLVETREDRK